MKKILNIVFLFIGIGFFIKLTVEYDLDTIWSDLNVIGAGFLWILLTWILSIFFDTITWKQTLGEAKNKVSFVKLGLITAAGQSINAVAPSGNIGELVKGKHLAKLTGGTRTVSSLIIFNFIHLAGSIMLISTGAAISLFLPQVPDYIKVILVTCAVVLIGILILAIFILERGLARKIVSLIKRLRIPLKQPEKWIENANSIDQNIREFRNKYPKDFWISIVAQAFSRACSVVEVYLICLLLQKPIDLYMAFFIMSISQLLFWMFAMVPSQIGVMEQSSDVVFKAIGYKAGLGFAFELVRRARRLVQIGVGLLILMFLSFKKTPKKTKPASAPGEPIVLLEHKIEQA
ncbi:MAG: flippase-like domain-containing protein [Deltaproteobacteria bacterium]|nr:flippase-like domain-containing protein [Deltaproteobacteria bacterium]